MSFRTTTLQLINDARAARGLAPLQRSAALEAVAHDGEYLGCGNMVVHGRAVDMGERNYLSHAIKDCANRSFTHMLVDAGVVHSGAGENVGFLPGTDDEEVAASNLHGQFMDEPGHKAHILDPAYTHIGIGVWHTLPGGVWRGAPPPTPPNSPLGRVFITAQVFAANPVAPAVVGETGASYHAIIPSRLLDTRDATGVPAAAPLGGGATLDLQVTGRGGVPGAGVAAVILNVTVTGPTAGSFLTVFPTGAARPDASNLNFTPGLTVANLTVTKVGAAGKVSIFNASGSTHVIADVAGWFEGGGGGTGSRYHPVVPSRILDSRAGNGGAGPVGPGVTLDLPVLSRGGVPAAGVGAVAVNVTVTGPTAPGFLTVFPTGDPRPLASNLNFEPGMTVPNLVVAKLGAGGSISIFNPSGTTEVIADVAGWFDEGGAAGAQYHPVVPVRILDTRSATGGHPGKLGPGATMDLLVAGAGTVPSLGVGAVVLNVTVAEPTAESFLTVFPSGAPRPNAANLNDVPGQVVPNLVMAKLGAGGRVSIFNQAGATHVIADVAGWFDAG